MIALDITPEMEALLRAGAADRLGICCPPGQVEKNWKHLREAERLGYLRFPDVTRPWITEAGRKAIGAPCELDASLASLRALLPKRKPLVPAKRDDPRTDFDYRSYKNMRWVCTLVVRQPDERDAPKSLRVGRTLRAQAQYLGAGNSIIQPESQGRFVLTLVPQWMTGSITRFGKIEPPIFSTFPLPIPEDDPDFDADERAVWDRLRQVCASVNSRIRTAGRKVKTANLRYGETA